MAAQLAIVLGSDGALYLVGTVDGVKHAFANVNASQVAADRVEQGADPPLTGSDDVQGGAYTGPASDITPSAHLADSAPTDSAATAAES